jgi:hypothetical protein
MEKQSKDELTENLNEIKEMKEYSITEGRPVSQDAIILYLWFEYLHERDGKYGYGAPVYLKQIDGIWKIDDPQANEGR